MMRYLPFSLEQGSTRPCASIDCDIESPPAVFYGDAEESTGALVSGQVVLIVEDDVILANKLAATLNRHSFQRRPYHHSCLDCQHQCFEIGAWNFLSHPVMLRRGRHWFPFSILIPGNLPTTLDSPNLNVNYESKVAVRVAKTGTTGPALWSSLKFKKSLVIKRSLPEAFPVHPVIEFSPTMIKASIDCRSTIYPAEHNRVTLRLDGLADGDNAAQAINFWRPRRLTWALHEIITTSSPACPRHRPETVTQTGQLGLTYTDVRILGSKDVYRGWRCTYDGIKGAADIEFDYTVTKGNEIQYACDTRTPDGTEIRHLLEIEVVANKESAPVGKPLLVEQTGTFRSLKLRRNITLTEHPGSGISWDNEVPPIYQDIAAGPPAYSTK